MIGVVINAIYPYHGKIDASATDAASCKREVPEVKNVVKEQLSILEMVLITIAVLTVVIFFIFLFYKKEIILLIMHW